MTIRISSSEFEKIRSQALESYPEECCGILVGTLAAERKVREAIPTKNTREDSRPTRYTIDPKEIWLAEKKYEQEKMGVIGFYHSHPDVPAQPSGFDLQNAWPVYSYIIVTVRGKEVSPPASWVLTDDRSAFREEKLIVEE